MSILANLIQVRINISKTKTVRERERDGENERETKKKIYSEINFNCQFLNFKQIRRFLFLFSQIYGIDLILIKILTPR